MRDRRGAPAAGTKAAEELFLEDAVCDARGPQMLVCGVDEVGRGPLAGPVVACAAALTPAARTALREWGVTDSKAMSAAAREEAAEMIWNLARAGEAWLGLGAASAREIEARNILGATDLAMRRAVGALSRARDASDPLTAAPMATQSAAGALFALVDGKRTPPDLGCEARAIVKGDARCVSIAAASVVAKVLRDGLMRRLDGRYPAYGWARNAGYPTAEHRESIVRAGLTPHHRRSFRTVAAAALAAKKT